MKYILHKEFCQSILHSWQSLDFSSFRFLSENSDLVKAELYHRNSAEFGVNYLYFFLFHAFREWENL